ncbi:MAG: DUF3500 domain-containing protein [Chitinophagaceae bacterium]
MYRLLLASFFIFSLSHASAQNSFAKELQLVATDILDSMNDLQKKRVLFDMNDSARVKWNNLPIGLRARVGVNIGAMTEGQRTQLHRLISVSLSSQGYLKSTGVFHMDNLLNMMYDTLKARGEVNDRTYKFLMDLQWTHKNFYLAFFGDPRAGNNWGYKIEGHHISLNFTVLNGKVAVTPFFIGSDPAEYRILDYAGWRILGQEDDLGLKLVNSFTPEMRKRATWDTIVPGDIITAAESGKRLINNWGVKGSEMNAAQRDLVARIIREYVFNFEWEKANEEYDKIMKAGLQNVYFGWIGPYTEDKSHYFMLNGPTFLIEMDNRGNHIHTIWREKGNEYGEDLLRKHYLETKH